MITKALSYICAALMVAVVIMAFMLGHKNRVIASMEQSIEHGAAIQRVRLEMDSIEAARIEQERKESMSNIAKIEELKSLLNAPRPTRPTPRNKQQLRDSFHRALDTP